MRVLFYGFHGEASGYGVAAGLHVRALERAGVEVERCGGRAPERTTGRAADVAVVHCPPDRVDRFLPLAHARAARTILFSVWETPELPGGWIAPIQRFHSVWVPSAIAARAFASAARPIAVVPHPIALRTRTRRSFPGVHADDIVFFAAFEWQGRKNPEGLLRAFMHAFAGRRDVVLLLKVGFQIDGRPDEVLSRLRSLTDRAFPRVLVVVDTLSPAHLRRALSRADAVISLHRAEGFGLVVAEAAACGVPLVCSAAGGPQDFLDPDAAYWVEGRTRWVGAAQKYPFSSEMTWLEPDHDAAVSALRRCAEDARERLQRGARARANVASRLDPLHIGEQMRSLLTAAP